MNVISLSGCRMISAQILHVLFMIFGILKIQFIQGTIHQFPDDFLFGVSTSSYQIEGGWNEAGRADSIWDYYLHLNPDYVKDRSNGDIACDSYHNWKEDIQLMKGLGVNFYRFSISWTRILPQGYKNTKVNQDGVNFYNNIINSLLSEGIKPYVTIYHWDLPQTLQERGGWLNRNIIEDYIYYAKLLFKLFGDRVKYWITFNEFFEFCEQSYSQGVKAPFLKLQGIGGYICGHHALLAHGRIYRIYQQQFKSFQNGKPTKMNDSRKSRFLFSGQVGVAVDSSWGESGTTNSEASERYMQFYYGWFTHPIIIGNYPPIMIERIGNISASQGFAHSRLPEFGLEEIEMLKGSFDFIGLNHYSTYICNFSNNFSQPSFDSDSGIEITQSMSWPASGAPWLKYVPWGLRKLLVWIKDHYDNPPLLITENGWASTGVVLNDKERIRYINGYLNEILKAIHEDNCNVLGYTVWSLMDNFEWDSGYTVKFGLIHVDFDSPNRTRRPRTSYRIFQEIIKSKKVQDLQ